MLLLTAEIQHLVERAIRAAQTAGDLPAFDLPNIEIKPTDKPEFGDYTCPVALGLSKIARTSPQNISAAIAKHLPPSATPDAPFFGSLTVVGGYLNFALNSDWLKTQVEQIIAEDSNLAQLDLFAGKRAQVEFVSANPTGPLHIGRSRGAIVGDTMARMLQAAGYTVEREYYFNNGGVQMQNLGNSLRIRYLEALGQPVEMPAANDKTFYQGEYLKDFAQDLIAEHGATWATHDWQPFKEYAEKRMFAMIKTTLQRVNITHDVFFNENSLYDDGLVEQAMSDMQANGHLYEAEKPENAGDPKATAEADEMIEEGDGKGKALWFRSFPLGDAKDRVMRKSDGSHTYTAPDIAYHRNKIERGFDLMLNVLGADHGAQYKVVQYGMRALGLDPSGIHVILLQLVKMIREGKEVKISTRRGNYETLDDLIDLTSVDAVRYLLLERTPNTQMNFDLDLAVKKSNDNPVYYIQYAHVRCESIFKEAKARGVDDTGADITLLGDAELKFIRAALKLPEVIQRTATQYEPHAIAHYALEMARLFQSVYENVRVLQNDVPPATQKARLRFYRAARTVFKRVLDLMGMSAPDVM
jgi:arginyl-tRNA synthetase